MAVDVQVGEQGGSSDQDGNRVPGTHIGEGNVVNKWLRLTGLLGRRLGHLLVGEMLNRREGTCQSARAIWGGEEQHSNARDNSLRR